MSDEQCCGCMPQDQDCCIDETGELIQRLVRTLQLFERATLTRHGFTFSQCYTMLNIHQNKVITMNELSTKMNLDTSTMTRVVNRLLRDDYLHRERNPEDRRVVFISLTEKGKEAAEELAREVSDFYRNILNQIPRGEVNRVFSSVQVLLRAFEQVKPLCC
jgi:MarR family transcriptional regulator, organic hydroperoxide resistance regulator